MGEHLVVQPILELPNGWVNACLSDACEIVAGQSPPSSECNASAVGVPFFQGKAEFGRINPTVKKWTTSDCKIAEPGDVLLSVRAPVGPTNIADTRCGIGRGLVALRAKPSTSTKWILYWLRFSEAILASQGTGTTFQAITVGVVQQHPLPLPPIAEQRRIVARIDELFAEIAEGEAALARARAGLETFRRALLKAAVTGELTREWREANHPEVTGAEILLQLQAGRSNRSVGKRGSKRDISVPTLSSRTIELPHLPETWAWASLAQLGDFGRGKSRHRPRDDARLYGGTIPFIQTGVVANCGDFIDSFAQTYSDFGLAQSRLWPPGTLCITIAANIAKTGILKIAACFPDSIVGLIPDDEINPYFVHMWMQTVQKRIEKYAPATAQKNINLEVLEQVAVPVPPPDETAEILRRVSDALTAQADTLALLDAEAADAARLRQAVLKAAFEGRLVPQDPTDEPARAMLARLAAQPTATAPRRRGRPKRTER